MRKVLGLVGATLLFAGPALAADLGRPPPVYKAPALVPVFSWTGWYIGGNIGYGWGESTSPGITDNIGFAAAGLNIFPGLKPKGFIGGGQIGYDWQLNPNWVLGVVADFQGADIKASGANTLTGGVGLALRNRYPRSWTFSAQAAYGSDGRPATGFSTAPAALRMGT
jgi:outer membrane immunogenic protein